MSWSWTRHVCGSQERTMTQSRAQVLAEVSDLKGHVSDIYEYLCGLEEKLSLGPDFPSLRLLSFDTITSEVEDRLLAIEGELVEKVD